MFPCLPLLRAVLVLQALCRTAARFMATPGGLKFLNDINNRNVLQVQHALRKGHAHPNQNYLSVYPLNLAIENVRLGSREG